MTHETRYKLLFIDDSAKRIRCAIMKYRNYDLWLCPSIKEALRVVSRENFAFVCLDHDLNGNDFQDPADPTSGMEFVRYMEKYGWPHPQTPVFIVHTSNLFAANEMTRRLHELGFYVRQTPFDYSTDAEAL